MRVNIYKVPETDVLPVTVAELRSAMLDAWEAGSWDDDCDFAVDVEETDAVLTRAAVDSDGKPIAPCACSKCGWDGWADVDSVTPYCPMCGRKVRR